MARLDEVCEVILGQSPPGASVGVAPNGLPFFQGKTEFGETHPTVKKWTTAPTKVARVGDVLVSVRAPVGPTNLAPFECCIGRGLAAIRPGREISTPFLLWAMRSTESKLARKATGTTFPAISGGVLKAHTIPVVALAEQERIVARIESGFETIRAGRDRVGEASRRLALLRASTYRSAFSGAVEFARSRGALEDAPLPPGWSWERFDQVATIRLNLLDPNEAPAAKHVAPNNIESGTGRLLAVRTIAEDGVTSPKHGFFAGQILYSKIRPYLNKVTIAPYEGLCSADMYPIDAKIHARFLLHWMLSVGFTEQAIAHQGRSVLPKINKKALQALLVPVPPKNEQVEIAASLDRVLEVEERIREELDAATARSDVLEASILDTTFPRGIEAAA